jgi:hypothetical protein
VGLTVLVNLICIAFNVLRYIWRAIVRWNNTPLTTQKQQEPPLIEAKVVKKKKNSLKKKKKKGGPTDSNYKVNRGGNYGSDGNSIDVYRIHQMQMQNYGLDNYRAGE